MQHKNFLFTISVFLIGFNMINAMDAPTPKDRPVSGSQWHYSLHVLERMNERNIKKNEIKRTIARNIGFAGKDRNSIVYEDISNPSPLRVIVSKALHKNGKRKIITAYRTTPYRQIRNGALINHFRSKPKKGSRKIRQKNKKKYRGKAVSRPVSESQWRYLPKHYSPQALESMNELNISKSEIKRTIARNIGFAGKDRNSIVYEDISNPSPLRVIVSKALHKNGKRKIITAYRLNNRIEPKKESRKKIRQKNKKEPREKTNWKKERRRRPINRQKKRDRLPNFVH